MFNIYFNKGNTIKCTFTPSFAKVRKVFESCKCLGVKFTHFIHFSVSHSFSASYRKTRWILHVSYDSSGEGFGSFWGGLWGGIISRPPHRQPLCLSGFQHVLGRDRGNLRGKGRGVSVALLKGKRIAFDGQKVTF